MGRDVGIHQRKSHGGSIDDGFITVEPIYSKQKNEGHHSLNAGIVFAIDKKINHGRN